MSTDEEREALTMELLDVAIALGDVDKRAAELRARRDELADKLHEAGVSWRTIASWAGVSHVALVKRS